MNTLVVGVQLSEVFQTKVTITTARRYNEITGEPYEKTIQKKTVILFGKLLEENNAPELINQFWLETFLRNSGTNLSLFRYGEGDYDFIIGLVMGEQNHRNVIEVSTAERVNKQNRVWQQIRNLGQDCQPKIYSINYNPFKESTHANKTAR